MWYFYEDPIYIREEYLKGFNKPVLLFDKNDLNGEILKNILSEKRDVLAPFLPPESLKPLFVIKELPNKYQPFTSVEYEYLNSLPKGEREKEEAKLLEEKLGLRLFKPNVRLSELGGMQNLKRYVSLIKILEEANEEKLKIKGIFLVGLAGTGKSYSAKAVAGELNRILVELNLSKIMESPNPIFALHKVFQYLEKLSIESKMKFILWIDEIEKMFASLEGIEKKVLGQLLTILNDLNTEEGYKIDAIFWATANDIEAIMERNPEFLRSGRFDKLFFVDTPCYPYEAIDIFKIYFKNFGIPYLESRNAWGELVRLAQHNVWEKLVMSYSSPDTSVFIYTPAEITQLCKEVKRDIFLLGKNYKRDLNELKDYIEVVSLLREIYNDLSPHFEWEYFERRLNNEAIFFKRFIEFLKEYRKEYEGLQKWEIVLLALFYNEMFNVSPILKTAKETITRLRNLAKEHFVKVSECK